MKYLVTVEITTRHTEEHEIVARNIDEAWELARDEYGYNYAGRSDDNEIAEVTDIEEA